MPSSIVFLPLFPTGCTTNIKDQSWQVTVDSFIGHTWAFCPKCGSFSSLASLHTAAAAETFKPSAHYLLAENERLQQAPEAQALHVVKLHIHFLLLLPFLVQFPSPLGCRSQFLGYKHFLLFPLRSTMGTFLHTVISICQHGNPKSAEAACCSQHLPHLFVLWRYRLGLLHSKTVIKKKLLPVRTGTRKR